MVYIREAHPSDGWAVPGNKFQLTDPKTLEERRKVAKEFTDRLKVSIPVLVDTIDDRLGKAYAGWPDRLYVLDAKGKVALKGAPGPLGFVPAVKGAPAVLDKLLTNPR